MCAREPIVDGSNSSDGAFHCTALVLLYGVPDLANRHLEVRNTLRATKEHQRAKGSVVICHLSFVILLFPRTYTCSCLVCLANLVKFTPPPHRRAT